MASDRLLEGFERALSEEGFARLTQSSIAAAAGLNRVTLYRQGVTREALLTQATAALAAGFRDASVAALTEPGSARSRLSSLLSVLFSLIDEHAALLAELYDGPTLLFHFRDAPESAERLTRFEYSGPFERLLRDGESDGSLTSRAPKTDAELLFNTASWTYLHLRRSHGWSRNRARREVLRVALAFVLPVGDAR